MAGENARRTLQDRQLASGVGQALLPVNPFGERNPLKVRAAGAILNHSLEGHRAGDIDARLAEPERAAEESKGR
jgi:hypothetical protein